jgi:hypothetical protein
VRSRELIGRRESANQVSFTLRVGDTPYIMELDQIQLPLLRDWLIKVLDSSSEERERELERELDHERERLQSKLERLEAALVSMRRRSQARAGAC